MNLLTAEFWNSLAQNWFVKEVINLPYYMFFKPLSPLFLPYIAFYIAVGAIVYIYWDRKPGDKISVKSILAYCFPKDIWLSKQGKLDLWYYFLIYSGTNIFVRRIEIMEILRTAGNEVSAKLGMAATAAAPTTSQMILSIVLTVMITDLGYTFFHWVLHRVPFLWEFHKVHHAATQLNSLTGGRIHPVERVGEMVVMGAMIAIGAVFMNSFFGFKPSILQMTIAAVAFNTLPHFNLLRHTHIWVSFGKPLSYIFNSPSMHQIHHSIDPKHWNKNFARYFSFFDLLFGSLYIPEKKENLKFGIPEAEWGNKNFGTVFGNVVHPFLPDSWLAKGNKVDKAVTGVSTAEGRENLVLPEKGFRDAA